MPTPFTGPLAASFAHAVATMDDASGRRAALADLLVEPTRALPLAPATDRAVWSAVDGLVDAATVDDLVARAGKDLGTPWPLPLASTTARLHRDGNRTAHEEQVFARQHRLSRAVVAAAVTGEDRWVDEVADGLWALCEQSSWCWPAHDDAFATRGWVLPDPDRPFLDLGAGEVAGQLAWTDHLLGDLLRVRYPGLRERVRAEARRRVVEPFVERRDWHWIGLDGDVHNWNPWIHGNVLVAALRLLDDPADAGLRAHVVDLVIEGLDRYVAVLPEDGAIDEGYEYWWNGACRALEALDVLAHATGGALDALDPAHPVPALRATVAFPHRMHLGGPWYLDLADGRARPPVEQPWHALHRAARRAGDEDARRHAASYRVPGAPVADETAGLARLLRALTDGAWTSAAPEGSPLPRDVWLASTQVLLAREEGGSPRGLTLAVKGGHNGEHHNHNDVGSFVVASDGVPVLVDAGRPTYTAQTFGPDRYAIWTMQSSWHNVPEIAGTPQEAGEAFAARDVVAHDGALSLDLAGAYPVDGLASWRRVARIERDASPSRVVVADAWDLGDAAPAAAVVHLLLAGDVTVVPGEARVVPLDGAPPVVVRWPADVPHDATRRALDDPMLTAVWGEHLTRLTLDVTDRTDLTLVVVQDDARDLEGAA
ncbi:heparinase II/III domain-containing protein [Cellulosimicrobium marinum]|uniref:heparinase II/III domain-containing protein n=1 Tax=Cellulosimicrobium marinum TaxID=1638992 RepID=UPI001E4F8D66|nr:heparinase II/III family protein [Cellulosimicrobium marinum]MCB7137434.1 heparinase II/III-family protein [Cellulosimicrobium marinum]